ncbi:type IV pilin [Haloplanus pelagicus]|uniref:type IV pilin n=1 Tax=Haloplanus pelagicus TaxID=2949995 RepID=UPI002040F557|nr:type IV pilin [Haloplanus sp. HW8-1]
MDTPCRERGVSPVVGVALMVALVVVLALVLATLALGVEMPSDPHPQYSYRTEYVADGEGNTNDRPYVTLTLSGGQIEVGEDFYIVDSDGNEVRWDAVWTTSGPLTAGDYAHVDGYGSDSALNHACEGEVYRFIHRPNAEESAVLATIEIERPAVGPATAHC